MKTTFLLTCALILVAATGCEKQTPNLESPEIGNAEIGQTEKALATTANDFGFSLYQNLLTDENASSNVLVSPLSISMTLGMTIKGAAGTTYDEMRTTLGLEGMSPAEINQGYANLLQYLPAADPNTTTNIANSIWYRQEFSVENDFIATNTEHFAAEVSPLNFDDPTAKDVINGWVVDKTNGMIESIVDQISPATVMYVINALYFNAPWSTEFDPDATVNQPWYKADGTTVGTDMMVSGSIPFGYYQNDQVTIVDLPYGNSQYHFTALMPAAGSTIGELANDLDAPTWHQWMGSMATVEGFTLELPKFTFDYEIGLNDALQAMGMQVPFTDAADFTGISSTAPLKISQVKHKTAIEVDESGTEAAAVTSVEITVTSLPPTISLNRPFLIVIHEKETGAILFMGQLMDPTA